MTRALAESRATVPQLIADKPLEGGVNPQSTFNPLPPQLVGFNGGSTEQGVEKSTVTPVFELGELKVTSLPTVEGTSNANMGSKTCEYSCGGSCKTCSCYCGPTGHSCQSCQCFSNNCSQGYCNG